ncbi:unnamed protein product [Spirodela intermedia]|uniref:Uncharacterized protein n=1 Tax=Spirodela intermedia TaxID=51605 RepID=A0A7I8JZB5_SPIIN|nr:unnamed protein product [Spirodela intermedia]
MGNSLRCCLACVLPFGVLDVARIVHLNGQVEEFCRPVTAGEILRANPDHVLSRPSSEGEGRRILVVSPESILERGTIYFLIPRASLPERKNTKKKRKTQNISTKVNEPSAAAEENLSERKPAHRRRSSRIAEWRPHLESIPERTRQPQVCSRAQREGRGSPGGKGNFM